MTLPAGSRLGPYEVAAPIGAGGMGEVEPLDDASRRYPLAFTSDGTAVVFEDRGEASNDIGRLRLDGEPTSTILLGTEFSERNAALSRDGRWLAYQSDESGRSEIYVRPFPDVDAGRWQISTDGGQWPVWNPAGDELFYRGASGLMVLTFGTEPTFTPGARTQLFAWEFVGGTNRRMAVSPDGERFLLLERASRDLDTGGDATNDPPIILVENWFEELKARVPN